MADADEVLDESEEWVASRHHPKRRLARPTIAAVHLHSELGHGIAASAADPAARGDRSQLPR